MTQCFNVCPRFLPLFFQQRMCVILVQPAVCGIYNLPPFSSFFLFLFSSIEKRKSFFTPQRGVFCSSWKRGRTFAPHISFSLAREKETCRARYKEKERWERPCGPKAAPFSFVLYVLIVGSLVLCGLVSPLAPLTLRGAGTLMDHISI